jgi:hypothetical protein
MGATMRTPRPHQTKLGDMTKRYENLEAKFRNLREIGIIEANTNVEKLRKQCEATTSGMVFSFALFE